MTPGSSPRHLRLVGGQSVAGYAEWEERQVARNAVVKENRLSAHGSLMDPDDPVLHLAAETRGELQGAVLTPERRERLLKLANRIGVRPFEASLVIAIEQDRARCAEAEHVPVQVEATPSPAPIPGATPAKSDDFHWIRWLAASATAAVLAAMFVRWLGLN